MDAPREPGRVQTFAALAQSLAGRALRRSTLLVGVDGPGGAGKSTFASGLAGAFEALDRPATVVHLDDFYRRAAERPTGPLEAQPAAGDFDWERARRELLLPLAQDRPGCYQRHDWPTDALAEWRTVPPGGAVILEGISALRAELAPFYDTKVWVESPRSLCLQRGLERDGEAARSQWEAGWMPAEERYFRLHRPQERADLWVDGSGRPGIDPQAVFIPLEREAGGWTPCC